MELKLQRHGDRLTGGFFFRVTTAYALMHANGVALGKPDACSTWPPIVTG